MPLQIGAGTNVGTSRCEGRFQEALLFDSSKSTANRASIEENVGDYFTQNTPLLDTYSGAAAAYSLRLLDSSYVGSAIRVRRSSDNTEQDINFNVFGELDTVSLLDFAGAGDAFVKTWYSQTGSNDATQTATGSQPKIVSSGAVIVENGKPAVEFDGSNDGLNNASNLRASGGASSVFMIKNIPQKIGGSSSEQQNPFAFYTVQRHFMGGTTDSFYGPLQISTNTTANESIEFASANLDGQSLFASIWDGTSQLSNIDDVSLHIDGTEEAQTASTTALGITASGTNSIGYRHDINSQYAEGTIQELVIYTSDQTSNRTNIESNINTFYSIT